MAFCDKCKNKVCLALKKPCEVVEKMLNSKEIRGYTDRHRRRKEVIYDPQKIEVLASEVAFKLRYGKKYNPNNGSMD